MGRHKKSAQGAAPNPDNDKDSTRESQSDVSASGPTLTKEKLSRALDAFEPEGAAPPEPSMFRTGAAPGRAGDSVTDEGTALNKMSVAELMDLRNDIDALLPATALNNINLEVEVMLQYQIAKELVSKTIAGGGAEPQQKAQVLNACTRILGDIVKMQTELFDAERIKMIENSLERAFAGAGVPLEVKQKFVTLHEEGLRELAAQKEKTSGGASPRVYVR